MALITLAACLEMPATSGAVTWFEDNFDGGALNGTRWNTSVGVSGVRFCSDAMSSLSGEWVSVGSTCHGTGIDQPHGSINVAGGQVTFSQDSESSYTFPYVFAGPPSRLSPFPPTGDFTLEIRMSHNAAAVNASAFHVLQNPNSDPVDPNVPGGGANTVFNVNGSSSDGVKAYLLGSLFTVGTGFHTYRLELRGNQYSVFVDGTLRLGPTTSAIRPNEAYFGNPLMSWWSKNDWNDITADYVRVTVDGYPRPKGATPLHASLVPAYQECGTTSSPSNRTHGPPLASPSCAPPQRASGHLTVGTPDANGAPAKSTGFVGLSVLPDNTGTPADEADLLIQVTLSDVREQGTLADYTGELEARPIVRLTDQLDGGGPLPTTTADFAFPFTVPCTATGDATLGAGCAVLTSANALVPGSVVGGKRAIWALARVEVNDGGSDGDAATPADNTLFAAQGLFVP